MADTSYMVSVNPSTLNGQYDYIDFQLNPGGANSEMLTAVITNFAPSATLNPADPNNYMAGNYSGSLPGPLTLVNSTQDNEYAEGLVLFNPMTFDITLSGPALTNPNDIPAANGTTFAIGIEDANGNMLLAGGPLGTINVNFDGSLTLSSAQDGKGNSYVTFGPVAAGVPEPATIGLAALSLLGLFGFARRKILG